MATTADGNLRYTAAPGEYNSVTFSRVGPDTFRVVDPNAAVSAGQGCTQDSLYQVTCTTAPGKPIIAHLGDEIDKAVSKVSRTVQFYGEDGSDRLAGASGRDLIDGGNGDDIVSGGAGRDVVRGGPGKDQVFGGGSGDVVTGGDGNDLMVGGGGNDSVNGGSGNDTMREDAAPNGADTLIGGDGVDTADYSMRSAPVKVDLNDVRDDGDIRSNEHDDVRVSTDVVLGGAGSDVLLGRETSSDTLIGGTGGDFIDGRRGADRIDGGPGIDQIGARDLSADTIACGDETDSVAADPHDLVASDCEKTRRTAAMSLALQGAAYFPTLIVKITCPRTAFKYCAGKIVISTLGGPALTAAVKNFSAAPGTEKLVGVRIRSGVAPYIRGGGLPMRARLSGFDGAGAARPDAVRFRLRRR